MKIKTSLKAGTPEPICSVCAIVTRSADKDK